MAAIPSPAEKNRGAIPYLSIKGATQALDFYAKAFGAKELMRIPAPGDTIGHAEIEIEGARVYLADEFEEIDFRSPLSRGGVSVLLCVYVADVDAVIKRAVEAGAAPGRPVEDKFYGERSGEVTDPFGHRWSFSTVKEVLSPEEMLRRAAETPHG